MKSGKGEVRTLLLVGGDYVHIQTVRHLARMRPENLRVIVISAYSLFPYEKLIPDYLRGYKSFAEIQMDLHAMCINAGFGFYRDEILRLDLHLRRVEFRDRPAMNFDFISLGLPGEAEPKFSYDEERLIPLQSGYSFISGWRRFTDKLAAFSPTAPPRLAVVGHSGLAAEVAFALHRAVRHKFRDASIDMLCSSEDFAFSKQAKVAGLIKRELANIGVQFHTGVEVTEFQDGVLATSDRQSRNFDYVFWAGEQNPPEWLRKTGLEFGPDGRVKVDRFSRPAKQSGVLVGGVFSSRYDRESIDADYVKTYAENVWRMAQGKGSLIEVKPTYQKAYFVDLSGNRALWVYRNFVFSGRLIGAIKRWTDQATVREFTGINAGESSEDIYVNPEIRYSGEELAKLCAPYFSELKRFKFSLGHRVLPFKTSNGVIHSRSESEVYGSDFFHWTKLLMIEAAREATVYGLAPDSYRIKISLSPKLSAFSLNYVEQVAAAAAGQSALVGSTSLDLRIVTRAESSLAVDCFTAAKPATEEVASELRPVNSAVIVTHALGAGSIYQTLAARKVRGVEFDRFVRSAQIYESKALKFFRRDTFFAVVSLHGLLIADEVDHLRTKSDVEFNLAPVKTLHAYPTNHKINAREGWQPFKGKKEAEWDVYCELFAKQFGVGSLLQVPLSEADEIVGTLRGLGYQDAAKIAEIRKAQKSKYQITFNQSE